MDQINKREHTRYPLKLDVDIFGHRQIFSATTEDISASGICFKTRRDLNTGEDYSIALRSELASLPIMQGRVIRLESDSLNNPRTVAIKFSEPNRSISDIVKLELRLQQGHREPDPIL